MNGDDDPQLHQMTSVSHSTTKTDDSGICVRESISIDKSRPAILSKGQQKQHSIMTRSGSINDVTNDDSSAAASVCGDSVRMMADEILDNLYDSLTTEERCAPTIVQHTSKSLKRKN